MKTRIVNRAASLLGPFDPDAVPLDEYVGACIATATGLIGVDRQLELVNIDVDPRGPAWTSDDRSAEILLKPGSTPNQRVYQCGRGAFMAVATNALGGMSAIPGRAWSQGGLWQLWLLAQVFAVESMSGVWGAGTEFYRASMESVLRQLPGIFGRLYRIGVDMEGAVGQGDLFRLGNPQFVVARQSVNDAAWLATLPAAAAAKAVRVFERVVRREYG